MAGTPATNNSSLPNDQNLVARLTATLGPVKTTNEAKTYLEQRSLIAIDNNYGMITLANLLITTSLVEDLAVAIVEKVTSVSEHLNVHMDHENLPVPNPTQQHTQSITSSYTNSVANSIQPPTLSPYTPETPEYVT